MTPAAAYRAVLTAATIAVKRGYEAHPHYGFEDLQRAYERVFGAFEVAVMCGARLEDSESPARWYERMERPEVAALVRAESEEV